MTFKTLLLTTALFATAPADALTLEQYCHRTAIRAQQAAKAGVPAQRVLDNFGNEWAGQGCYKTQEHNLIMNSVDYAKRWNGIN